MKKYLADLYRRRDLMLYLVASNLKAQHRNAYLGYLWWLLDPLLGVFIYYFVVVIIFQRGGENYAERLIVGMVVWRWLSATVTSAARSITVQAGIITQVYLPKAVFPMTASLSGLVNFGFGLVVLAIFFAAWGVRPGIALLWLPHVVVMQLLFTMTVALVIAYVSVFVRDLDMMVTHLMRLWFFASPVVWPEELIPERWHVLLGANPMAHFLAAFRGMFLENRYPDPLPLLGIGLASAAGIVALVHFYSRHEHRIIKAL